MSDNSQTIELARLRPSRLIVTVSGTAPLATHRWSEKARRMMLDAQQGKKTKVREVKDPQADFESSIYRLPDGRPGIPAAAFKAAIVSGARMFDKQVAMTAVKQVIFVEGEGPDQLLAIEGSTPELWEQMVRVASGTADIRYRARFDLPWRVTLPVRYFQSSITTESLLALIDAGGTAGVGEWRPSAPKSQTGSYGTFEVEDDTVKVIEL